MTDYSVGVNVKKVAQEIEGLSDTLDAINSNLASLVMVTTEVAKHLAVLADAGAGSYEIVEFKSKDGEYGQR